MGLLEIKDAKDESFTVLINLAFISNISMRQTAHSGTEIAIEISGRSKSYIKTYEVLQDAQNIFAELKNAVSQGGGMVTL